MNRIFNKPNKERIQEFIKDSVLMSMFVCYREVAVELRAEILEIQGLNKEGFIETLENIDSMRNLFLT